MTVIYMYLFCILPNCYGIKVPGLNKIKYSFSKLGSNTEVLSENPVYFLLSHKEFPSPIAASHENDYEAYGSDDVNVVNNNNYNDVLSSLKSKVFKKKPTVIDFRDELNLDDKNTGIENKVDESILKLAEIMLLVDRVIVPVDYLKLVKRGCAGVEEFRLLGLMTYALNTHTRSYPKVHIVIYNYRPTGRSIHVSKEQKEFIERQKYEINETINEFLNSFIKIVDSEEVNELLFEGVSVRCNYVEKYKDMKDLMKQFYNEDHSYYKSCVEDIDDEFNKKLTVCESIDKAADKARSLSQLRFDFGDYNELESNFEIYEQMLNLYKDSYHR
ncbi:hypothetical protein MACJ_003105 [Theileria orientalis]|uniref:Uncharacterized protein n=1 Tax=Theileria orientalis TaxID=68886 RepID=A0A976QT76_THEOR|nr:hypothetical protein MACJ_003105 [Theileria orientalis]